MLSLFKELEKCSEFSVHLR